MLRSTYSERREAQKSVCFCTDQQPHVSMQTIMAPGAAPASSAQQLQALNQPYPATSGTPSLEEVMGQLAAAPGPPAGAAPGTSPELLSAAGQLPGSGSSSGETTLAAAPSAAALGSARATRKFARAFGCVLLRHLSSV